MGGSGWGGVHFGNLIINLCSATCSLYIKFTVSQTEYMLLQKQKLYFRANTKIWLLLFISLNISIYIYI